MDSSMNMSWKPQVIFWSGESQSGGQRLACEEQSHMVARKYTWSTFPMNVKFILGGTKDFIKRHNQGNFTVSNVWKIPPKWHLEIAKYLLHLWNYTIVSSLGFVFHLKLPSFYPSSIKTALSLWVWKSTHQENQVKIIRKLKEIEYPDRANLGNSTTFICLIEKHTIRLYYQYSIS